VPGPAEDPLGLHQALALGGGVGHRRGSAPREEGPAMPEDQHEGGGILGGGRRGAVSGKPGGIPMGWVHERAACWIRQPAGGSARSHR